MITAARLLGHKSVNGKYQSTLQLDKFPVLGHQMVKQVDSQSIRLKLTRFRLTRLTASSLIVPILLLLCIQVINQL